jgi:hypothetical protein
VDTDGARVVINAVAGFQEVRTIGRDPRLAPAVADAAVHEHALPASARLLTLERSRLGDDAAVRGAALTVIEHAPGPERVDGYFAGLPVGEPRRARRCCCGSPIAPHGSRAPGAAQGCGSGWSARCLARPASRNRSSTDHWS